MLTNNNVVSAIWVWSGMQAKNALIPVGVAFAAATTEVTNYVPVAEWLMVGLFGLLLFFVRAWMAQREKNDEQIVKATNRIEKRVRRIEVKLGLEAYDGDE